MLLSWSNWILEFLKKRNPVLEILLPNVGQADNITTYTSIEHVALLVYR